MVTQVVVVVGYQDVKNHTAKQFCTICLDLTA